MNAMTNALDARFSIRKAKAFDASAAPGLVFLRLINGRPTSRRIVRAVKEAIQHGWLVPGDAMLSRSAIAEATRTSRNTVARAFASLISEGYLTAAQGNKVFVACRAGSTLVKTGFAS